MAKAKIEETKQTPLELENNQKVKLAIALLYEKLSRALNTPVHELKEKTITIIDHNLTIQ